MNAQTLGKLKLDLPPIGFGCMSVPGEEREARTLLEAAYESGIRFFDTADLYAKGRNEEFVGRALAPVRKQVLLATKFGNVWDASGDSWHWDAAPERIERALHSSLNRLQTDVIDLYQLHGGTMDDRLEEIVEELERLREEGLIRAYGISSIRPNVIDRFLRAGSAATVMMQYSALDRRAEEWFSMIEERGASVIARGALAQGLLTDSGVARAKRKEGGYSSYSQEELVDVVSSLAPDRASKALHFALRDPAVGCALIGASSIEQLHETLHAFSQRPSEQALEAIDDQTDIQTYKEHRL